MTEREELLNHGDDGVITLYYVPTSGYKNTVSGYGAKIPTNWVVKYKNRSRRVYCTIYGNIGTCWFLHKDRKMVVG